MGGMMGGPPGGQEGGMGGMGGMGQGGYYWGTNKMFWYIVCE